MQSGIYQIRNTLNDKRYIGSAVDLKDRFRGHIKGLRNNRHHSKHLQYAWNKYGSDAFKFEVLLYCAKHDLLFYEQRAINVYKSFSRRYGYNIFPTAGSSLGHQCYDSTRRKISLANKGKVRSEEVRHNMSVSRKGHVGWNKGKVWTQESRQKLSKALTGRLFSEETRRKLSESNKGRGLGSHPSEETRRKMSIALKGHTAWNKGLPSLRKGIPVSDAQKLKQSLAMKGRKLTEERRQKLILANLGRKHTEEAKRKISIGNKGKVRSAATKQKIRLANIGRISPMFGKRHSEETKRKISESKKGSIPWIKGRHHSEETKRRISQARLGKPSWHKGEVRPFLGRHHSEETKKKMSETIRKVLANKKKSTGIFIRTRFPRTNEVL